MNTQHKVFKHHILSVIHTVPVLFTLELILVKATERTGIVLQQDAEREFLWDNIPFDIDMVPIIHLVFPDILHQVAAPTHIIKTDTIRIVVQPILQSLLIYLHQAIWRSNPYMSFIIQAYTIRVDELAHQSLAISEMLQVFHLIVQTVQAMVCYYPIVPSHIIQESIIDASEQFTWHLQLSEVCHG